MSFGKASEFAMRIQSKARGIRLSKKRTVFPSSSGDSVAISKRGVVKFFAEGNVVYPRPAGRKSGPPITNHEAIKYYSSLMHEKFWEPHTAYTGAKKIEYFSVRPVKLIKESARYHVVERVAGPNLQDLLSYVQAKTTPKLSDVANLTENAKLGQQARRDSLARFIKSHKNELRAWKSSVGLFHNEFSSQLHWITSNSYSGITDMYQSHLKESDFIVEGFEKREGKVIIKLVMADFK
ncbi:MAG: hypothetical protein WCW13_00700 [archaeon]|jgi:hypothetical protein